MRRADVGEGSDQNARAVTVSAGTKRGRRVLKRVLITGAVLLGLAEGVVRVAGLDPPPCLSPEDVEPLTNVRRHTRDYPEVEARLARTRANLARLQEAKAGPEDIDKAKKDLELAEKDMAWEKAHWPSKKFKFRGYWPGVPIEFEQDIELNDLWLRDYDYDPNKPPNVRRMVILGDSYTTAWEVKFDEMYHKRLAQELTKLAGPGRKVEVPAFSLPSMGIADLKKRFFDQAMGLRPDMVTLVVAGTLISENYKPLQKELDLKFGRLVKYFIADARRVESSWLLLSRSALNRLIARTAAGLYIYHLDWFEDLTGRHPIDPSMPTFFEPTPPKWDKAWEGTLAALEEFSRDCRRAGVPLLVVVMPTEPTISVFAQAPPGYRIDWGKVDRKFAEFCKQVGADFLTMTPGFAAYRAQHGRDYRPMYDIHWNAKGHDLAARIILEHVRSRYAGPLGLNGATTSSVAAR